MVNRIAIRAYMTRMYARIYMASNDETQAKKVEDTIVELLKAYDQLEVPVARRNAGDALENALPSQ